MGHEALCCRPPVKFKLCCPGRPSAPRPETGHVGPENTCISAVPVCVAYGAAGKVIQTQIPEFNLG
eukprot:1160141-Pelagomonas_calceolata.AAC.12